jgi:hypothetical protein
MEQALVDACERLRMALESRDNQKKIEAYAIRKGRTMYVVSQEARELRRFDAIYSEAR